MRGAWYGGQDRPDWKEIVVTVLEGHCPICKGGLVRVDGDEVKYGWCHACKSGWSASSQEGGVVTRYLGGRWWP